MAINLATVLDSDGGKIALEKFLDKKLLERADWETVLANGKFALTRPIPKNQGQYVQFTRKKGVRRPQNMQTPFGSPSDPSSGASLTGETVTVPLEYFQEYVEIGTPTLQTSWLPLREWAEDDMPRALTRRMHEKVQNAMDVGRYAPGVWSSTSDTPDTDFDQTIEASYTDSNMGMTFTFASCPKYYAGGVGSFAELDPATRATWADFRKLRVRLENSHAPKIGGHYPCVISAAMWEDLMMDDDGGKLTANLQSGNMGEGVSAFQNATTFRYAGFEFIIDEQPYTQDEDGKRAAWGGVHSAFIMGRGCYGMIPLAGETAARPKWKVQDTSKTGVALDIGYNMPWQVAVVNENWGAVFKSYVSESKPNNYTSNPDQMDGLGDLTA